MGFRVQGLGFIKGGSGYGVFRLQELWIRIGLGDSGSGDPGIRVQGEAFVIQVCPGALKGVIGICRVVDFRGS